MIYKKVDLYEFRNEFIRFGRDSFSDEGYRLLFEHLNDLVHSGLVSGGIELDVIALDCEYTEAPLEEVLNDYDMDIRTLEDHTTVIWVDSDTIIYRLF